MGGGLQEPVCGAYYSVASSSILPHLRVCQVKKQNKTKTCRRVRIGWGPGIPAEGGRTVCVSGVFLCHVPAHARDVWLCDEAKKLMYSSSTILQEYREADRQLV